jgi:hypothetical protein
MALSRLFLFLPLFLFSMEIGNPEQPYLQKIGLLLDTPKTWSVRLAYLDDYVYRMRFKDLFLSLDPSNTNPVFIKLMTNAGILTLNLRDRIDVYTILGTSQLQVDREIYTKREFSWGVGGKILLAKIAKIRIGCDVKFFTSLFEPTYFVSDGFAFNVLDDYRLNYWEIQGALGASYRTKWISPFVHLTYLISQLDPQPAIALVRMPNEPVAVDAETRPFTGQRRWGMAIGATLLGSPKASITVESRFINQNAIDINGEFRF